MKKEGYLIKKKQLWTWANQARAAVLVQEAWTLIFGEETTRVKVQKALEEINVWLASGKSVTGVKNMLDIYCEPFQQLTWKFEDSDRDEEGYTPGIAQDVVTTPVPTLLAETNMANEEGEETEDEYYHSIVAAPSTDASLSEEEHTMDEDKK